MSDPVSNVEIEDVLSSIRRLVSDENRPASRRVSKEVPYKPTRLVLTPSLLVPGYSETEDKTETPVATESDASEDDATVSQAGSDMVEEAFESPEDSTDVAETIEAVHLDGEPAADDDSGDRADLAEQDQAENGSTDTSIDPWNNPDTTLFEAAETAESTDTGQNDDSDYQTEDSSFTDVGSYSDMHDAPESQFDESPVEQESQATDTDSSEVPDTAADQNEAPIIDTALDQDADEPADFDQADEGVWELQEDAAQASDPSGDDADSSGDIDQGGNRPQADGAQAILEPARAGAVLQALEMASTNIGAVIGVVGDGPTQGAVIGAGDGFDGSQGLERAETGGGEIAGDAADGGAVGPVGRKLNVARRFEVPIRHSHPPVRIRIG